MNKVWLTLLAVGVLGTGADRARPAAPATRRLVCGSRSRAIRHGRTTDEQGPARTLALLAPCRSVSVRVVSRCRSTPRKPHRQPRIPREPRIDRRQAAAHEDAARRGEQAQVLAARAEAGRHGEPVEQAPLLVGRLPLFVRHPHLASAWCSARASSATFPSASASTLAAGPRRSSRSPGSSRVVRRGDDRLLPFRPAPADLHHPGAERLRQAGLGEGLAHQVGRRRHQPEGEVGGDLHELAVGAPSPGWRRRW